MTEYEFLRQYNKYNFGSYNKYNNKKTIVGSKTFDSAKEAKRYGELRLLERAGKIKHLECQKEYTLIPAQKINNKVVERAVKYKADFSYYINGELIVEDAKGVRTDAYIIKRKLMLYVHGIKIVEV